MFLKNTRARVQVVLLAACAVMILAACSDSRTQIRIVGSSTVFPFTTAVVENFMRRNPRIAAPVVETTGTGGGIKLFCSGAGARYPDIVNASRRMTRRELQSCQAQGAGPIVEIQIGIDGVVLVQSKKGPSFQLTRRQIYLALASNPDGRPQRARNWRDIDPALPDLPIRVLGPAPTSGTRDAFNELYMQPGCRWSAAAAEASAESLSQKFVCNHIREDDGYVDSAENDNLIVQKLVSDPNALGVLGYSYLVRNLDAIRDVEIEGVPATVGTISEFRYPAARPLFIYVKADHVDSVRGLRQLLAEFSSERAWGPDGYLARRGLVPSGPAVRQANRRAATELIPLTPEDLQ